MTLHFTSLFQFLDKYCGMDQSIVCLHTSITITFKYALTLSGPRNAHGYLDTSETHESPGPKSSAETSYPDLF